MLPIEFRAVYTMRGNKTKKICKFSVTMPDANYFVKTGFNFRDGQSLGAISITDKTTTQCTVSIQTAHTADSDFYLLVYYFEDTLP